MNAKDTSIFEQAIKRREQPKGVDPKIIVCGTPWHKDNWILEAIKDNNKDNHL